MIRSIINCHKKRKKENTSVKITKKSIKMMINGILSVDVSLTPLFNSTVFMHGGHNM